MTNSKTFANINDLIDATWGAGSEVAINIKQYIEARTLSGLLCQIRHKAGKTQQDVADSTHKSVDDIEALENATNQEIIQVIPFGDLLLFALACNCTVQQFCEFMQMKENWRFDGEKTNDLLNRVR